ncbi:MAG TPA: cyclic nucleotide-binding domain-containing protein [Dehalococcoidia bacterium]|nr:cyclic nucleotide-binding domain-containing protein [Dehalococcoidia bacterium]
MTQFDRYFALDDEAPAASGPVPHALLFLPDWSEDDWARLLAHTERRRFRAGEYLIRAGERGRAIMIIAAGSLDVLLPGAEPRSSPSGDVEPGDVIGEVGFFDGSPRSASVRARTDGEARVLSIEAFEVFSAYEPALARELLLDLGRILAARLRAAEAGQRA